MPGTCQEVAGYRVYTIEGEGRKSLPLLCIFCLAMSVEPATELNNLLAKLTVGQVMTDTVTPTTPIQHAARIMLERKVSGLPVVNEEDSLI